MPPDARTIASQTSHDSSGPQRVTSGDDSHRLIDAVDRWKDDDELVAAGVRFMS